MRILLWAPRGAGTHYWGPGTSAFRLYSNNISDNVSVTLAHASAQQATFSNVYCHQVKLGVLDRKSITNKIIYLFNSIIYIIKNHKKFDVMHVLGFYWDSFIPAWLFSLLGGRCFIKITGDNSGLKNNGFLSRVTGLSLVRKLCANKFSGYIAISNEITELLKEYGVHDSKIFQIPNGVCIERFRFLSPIEKRRCRHLHGFPQVFSFVFCGGISERKRTFETVVAASIASQLTSTPFRLYLVGPDREAAHLIGKILNFVSDHGLNDVVKVVGATEEPELYYGISDAFILPSKSEGMSNALLEAMSCGIPSIVTKVSGSVDLIEEGVSGVFTTGQPEDIARHMHRFITGDVNIRMMGMAARQTIISGYSYDIVWRKHIELFSANSLGKVG